MIQEMTAVQASRSETAPKPEDRVRLQMEYIQMRRAVMAAGLLERRYDYYALRGLQCFGVLAVALALPFVVPAGFAWTALAAFLLGFSFVQVALLGHDAGHHAVFSRATANYALGLVCWSLTTGVGFWYWYDRHNRHHAHTNDVDDDPDLQGGGLVALTAADAAARTGWRRRVASYQAYLWPLVLLGALIYAFGFRLEGWLFALRKLRGPRLAVEVVLLTLNIALWSAAIGLGGERWLGIFLGSQLVASLYLSLIIAPNHKGMPVWAQHADLTFLERQVLSSRNVTAHPLWDFLFGGLNYQIEHHLFPNMPRVNFRKAQAVIKPFCIAHDLPYDEVDPLVSYQMVYAELRRVGQAAA